MNSRIYFELIKHMSIEMFQYALGIKVAGNNFFMEYHPNDTVMKFYFMAYEHTINLTTAIWGNPNTAKSYIEPAMDHAMALVLGYVEHRIKRAAKRVTIPAGLDLNDQSKSVL